MKKIILCVLLLALLSLFTALPVRETCGRNCYTGK